MVVPAVRDRVTISGVALGCRVNSTYARARLAQALHEVALDALDPSPSLGEREREWLRGAIERPIRLATQAALGTFAAELERALLGRAAGARTGEIDDE
jgi:hypothetical protein